MREAPFSQEFLKSVLDYEPATGEFCRKLRICSSGRSNGKWAGRPVGGLVKGYIKIVVDGKKYHAHHLAWYYETGVWPDEIDHRDLNKGNNRIDNLRESTRGQNAYNRARRTDNTSGQKGVVWMKDRRKWRAKITADLEQIYLGDFGTFEEASKAYKKAAVLYHGEFARI